MLKVLLVDYKPLGFESLKLSLETFCEEVAEIVHASTKKEAELLLLSNSFDMLFLSVYTLRDSSFELLKTMETSGKLPAVWLVSDYTEDKLQPYYTESVKGILGKPIDAVALKAAVKLVANSKADTNEEAPLDSAQSKEQVLGQRISLPHHTGFDLTPLSSIVRIQADGAYTVVYKEQGDTLTVSRGLKEFEKILPQPYFVRVHHSHLISLHHMESFTSENGGTAVMLNGDKVAISRRKLTNFHQKVKQYSLHIK